MNQVNIVRYEITAAVWPGLIGNDRMQAYVARYFAWKTKRKFKRYREHLEWLRNPEP